MKTSVIYTGIDVSKGKHDVAVIDDTQNILTPGFTIRENAAGFQQLLQRLEQIKQRCHAAHIYLGLEATGDYWKNLYTFIVRQTNWSVSVINPSQTHHFAISRLRRASTDPVDAADIARFMQERKPKPTLPHQFGWQLIRDLDLQLVSLLKQRNAAIYRLRLELGKTFPELEQRTVSFTSQQLLSLLHHYPTAELIHQAPLTTLAQLRTVNTRRKLNTALLEKVKQLADNSVASKTGAFSGIVAQNLTAQIMMLEQYIGQMKQHIVQACEQYTGRSCLLATIKGIAPLTAARLQAYIGDATRFPGAKQIVAYYGMNPTIRQSGTSIKRRSHLQKKGNPRVRNILFMSVLTMIRFKVDPIYSFYQTKVDEGKPKLVAIGAAMRKLLVICYTMLKSNTEFKPVEKKNNTLSKNS